MSDEATIQPALSVEETWTCRCGHTHVLRGALCMTCPKCGCSSYTPTVSDTPPES